MSIRCVAPSRVLSISACLAVMALAGCSHRQQRGWVVITNLQKDGVTRIAWAVNCAKDKRDSIEASRMLNPKGWTVVQTDVWPLTGWRPTARCRTDVKTYSGDNP